MNRYQATGRLTREPELRVLPDGTPVCQIRIAVKGMGRGGRAEAGYINISEFGKPGQASARTLTTGWLVAVDGRLEYHEWKTDDGKTRHDYRLIGSVEFLAAPKGADEAADASRDHDPDEDIPF